MRPTSPRLALASLSVLVSTMLATVATTTPAVAFVPPGIKVRPVAGDMVYVPSATYRFAAQATWQGPVPGSSAIADPLGYEAHVSAFWIDRTEVTVAAYTACVRAGKCKPLTDGDNFASNHSVLCTFGKAGFDEHPINCVSHVEAETYCEYMGKRLPTEREWELAERGPTSLPFPWGTEPPTPKHVNASDASCAKEAMSLLNESFTSIWTTPPDDDGFAFTAPVGTYPINASPYGALDLSGNVEEWVSDAWSDLANPAPPTPGNPVTDYVVRGGSWDLNSYDAFSGTRRTEAAETTRAAWLGFRCARGA